MSVEYAEELSFLLVNSTDFHAQRISARTFIPSDCKNAQLRAATAGELENPTGMTNPVFG